MTEHDTGAELRTWPHLTGVERGALRELLIHGPLPRAELARRLRVSRASMTRATRLLVENSLIAEDEITLRGAMGRPSEMLVVSDEEHHLLGVKLTGDAVFAVVTTLGARLVASIEEPLVSNSVEDTVDQIVRIHARFSETFRDIHAAGVCLAGDLATVDGQQIVVTSYFLRWHDVPLAALLSERMGIPVTADNDVRALTAAEHWFGAGAGCDSLALVTVGAGIGFGLVIDGRVVTGHNGRAGQLDHLLVDTTGPECGVGHHGCASAYLPSACIVQSIRDADADPAAVLDYDDAVARARAGDPVALHAFGDAARALGIIIGTILNGLDPEKIVLTGDGLAVMDLQGETVMQTIEATRMPSALPVPLDVQPFEFTEWARAGAVLAIRSLLRF